ncbi:MAG: prolyl oligopeptidase family serine peptidase [Myxococcota bacterium]
MTERPATARQPIVEPIHGVDVADPYRWLEGTGETVAAWTKAQDAHARGWLQAQPGRAALRSALRPMLEAESRSAPIERGDRWFFSRRRPGEDKSRHYVSEVGGAGERVLVDPAEFSADGSATVRAVYPSPDGSFVSFLVSENASDEATLHLRDVATGQAIDEPIGGARYAVPSWLPDESAFFYTKISEDPSIPAPQKPKTATIMRHVVGSSARFDERIYGPAGDASTFVNAEVSHDGRWLTLTRMRDFSSTDVSIASLKSDALAFHPLTETSTERTYVETVGDRVLAHTNLDAPRFRVLERSATDLEAPWRALIPEGPGTLEAVHITADSLVLQILDKAYSRLEVRDLDGRRARTLPLPGVGSVHAVVSSQGRDDVFILFSSFAQPPQWLHAVPRTGKVRPFWTQRTPIDTDRIVTEQVWVESRDGTPVSMFVVHRDDAPRDGERPTLLTGYGGFGVSLTPTFSPTAALWVAHGGVYAVPNLRGGGEYGEAWHEAGRREHKQNVFDDFIASGEWLIAQGWTRPKRLSIRGGSNGGLLVGAVMTQRPELFGAVVCEVPLLDMVRYELHGAGPTWAGEYGSVADPAMFEVLFAYSPYHRVVQGAPYPPLLMNSADSDDRVDPNHARKFVGAMQWATPDTHPVLLRVESNAGHGGADSVKARLEHAVDTLTFLRATVGQPRPERGR